VKEKSYLAWYHPTTSHYAGSRRIGVKTSKPGVDYRPH